MILDIGIEEFIEKHKLKPVSSPRIYLSGKLDPDGLYSEEIFGRLGSEERKHTFAYIDLRNHRIIHPEVYSSVL
ncbi:MAG: hypothetical protein QW835_00005 [Candidatus Hadarchaeum sp.]